MYLRLDQQDTTGYTVIMGIKFKTGLCEFNQSPKLDNFRKALRKRILRFWVRINIKKKNYNISGV